MSALATICCACNRRQDYGGPASVPRWDSTTEYLGPFSIPGQAKTFRRIIAGTRTRANPNCAYQDRQVLSLETASLNLASSPFISNTLAIECCTILASRQISPSPSSLDVSYTRHQHCTISYVHRSRNSFVWPNPPVSDPTPTANRSEARRTGSCTSIPLSPCSKATLGLFNAVVCTTFA